MADIIRTEWLNKVRFPQPNDIVAYFDTLYESNIQVMNIDSNSICKFKVKYKHINDCVRYFTNSELVYCVYIRLLRNAIAWSAHPRLAGIEGVIGNHVTIEYKNGMFDVQERIYTVKTFGIYKILARKTNREYHIHQRNFTSLLEEKQHYASIIWNEILDFTVHGDRMMGEIGGKDPSIIVTKRNSRAKLDETELVQTIEKKLRSLRNDLTDGETCAFVKIPYVPVWTESFVAKRLEALFDDVFRNFKLVSDHRSEYSVLGVNV